VQELARVLCDPYLRVHDGKIMFRKNYSQNRNEDKCIEVCLWPAVVGARRAEFPAREGLFLYREQRGGKKIALISDDVWIIAVWVYISGLRNH